jgi:hypothetical protein
LATDRISEYGKPFAGSPGLQDALEHFNSAVVEFCQQTIKVIVPGVGVKPSGSCGGADTILSQVIRPSSRPFGNLTRSNSRISKGDWTGRRK